MSDTALYLSVSIVVFAFIAFGAFILVTRAKQKKNAGEFRWEPEQDYDVVMKGESSMTPGFPTLVKREGKHEKPNSDPSSNTDE